MENRLNIKLEIEEWFEINQTASLELSGAFYGRPYDNMHRLSEIFIDLNKLIIMLDNDSIKLIFNGDLIINKKDNTKLSIIAQGAYIFDNLKTKEKIEKLNGGTVSFYSSCNF